MYLAKTISFHIGFGRRRKTLIVEHELEKQQSSIAERERIARDLHTLLGHTLTMVAPKPDLDERLIDSDPERIL